jgi:hypothetical protein
MMFDRLVVASVLSWFGVAGLLPDPPAVPLTAAQIQQKGKQKSVSNLCQKKKKSKAVKELCQKWGEQA